MKVHAICIGGIFLALLRSAGAEPDTTSNEARKFFQAGIALRQQAAATNVTTVIQQYLKLACEQFRRATDRREDFYEAHWVWAMCLFNQAMAEPKALPRRALLSAAAEQVVRAAGCTDVEWRMLQQGATGIVAITQEPVFTGTDRATILRAASQVYAASRQHAPFAGERAAVDRDWGECRMRLAETSTDPVERRTLYEQAGPQFEAAVKAQESAVEAKTYGLWGLSLLRRFKIDHDTNLLYEAVRRFETGLGKATEGPQYLYNLACCTTLLGQPDQGLRYLRRCFDADKDGAYLQQATRDTDLVAVREDVLDLTAEKRRSAIRNAGMSFRTYAELSTQLAGEIELRAATPAKRGAVREEIQSIADIGLALSQLDQDRALLERRLGICLARLAAVSPSPEEQRTLSQQALERFVSAAKFDAKGRDGDCELAWGETLLLLDRLDHDPALISQAVVKLYAAVELAPKSPEARFHLARAYARIGQSGKAESHLRVCFDNDSQGVFAKQVETDPDLVAFHQKNRDPVPPHD